MDHASSVSNGRARLCAQVRLEYYPSGLILSAMGGPGREQLGILEGVSWLSWPGTPLKLLEKRRFRGQPGSLRVSSLRGQCFRCLAALGQEGRVGRPGEVSCPRRPLPPLLPHHREGRPARAQAGLSHLFGSTLFCTHSETTVPQNNTYPFELQNIVIAFYSVKGKCQW